ncbi:MAG: GHMP kinase [Chloroflexi bacterium]|nr:GHMP kinase [Chloroflexota bacterium]
MSTAVPKNYLDTVLPMQAAHREILEALAHYGYTVEDYPDLRGQGRAAGSASAKAYPIQGILKYHGMTDWNWRIAYLPSISLNNDAAYSLTRVEFDPVLAADEVTINSTTAQGREFERVQHSLDVLRKLAGVSSRARVWSKNVVRASKTGKGLGTSASASAALAMAATAALFGDEAAHNTRFVTTMSRLLAGSGCRSAAGGIALWLSYPGIAHEDSFALRLDTAHQFDDLSVITVPLDSRLSLKTETAHDDAPNSKFFKPWMLNRREEIIECISAIQRKDWRIVGQLAELDSIQLHGVTMSGSRENKIFAWEPENISLFRLCNDLRTEGVPVYFSTDTGPTTVLLTHQDHENTVVSRIEALGFEVVRGKLGGPAALVDEASARHELGLV